MKQCQIYNTRRVNGIKMLYRRTLYKRLQFSVEGTKLYSFVMLHCSILLHCVYFRYLLTSVSCAIHTKIFKTLIYFRLYVFICQISHSAHLAIIRRVKIVWRNCLSLCTVVILFLIVIFNLILLRTIFSFFRSVCW
jgi:hypothetical protein